MTDTVYLVDASIYIFRAYFAIPDEWYSPEGKPVNALFGYTHFLLKFLQSARPRQLAVAYDESLGSCFRNEIYADYKISRALPDENLALQLAACRELTEVMGISSPASSRYEADDIIATLCSRAQQRGAAVSIVSRDKDLGQLLLTEKDQLWDFAADTRMFQPQFYQHFGVKPAQMVDYLALVGDSIDDIPGVPGVGKKTAAALLAQFGDIETLYQDLDAVTQCGLRGARGLAEKLQQYREQVAISQDLARLETRVPLGGDSLLGWQPPSLQAVRHFLDEFGLGQRFQRQLEGCYWWQV